MTTIAERKQAARDAVPAPTFLDRNEAIARIRKALRARSGKSWSVTGGRGTAWGWITILSPPARREGRYFMSEAERVELAALLGLEEGRVSAQGVSIPASAEYRRYYLDRAEGREPTDNPTPYWD